MVETSFSINTFWMYRGKIAAMKDDKCSALTGGRLLAVPPDRGSVSRSSLEFQRVAGASLRLQLRRMRCGSPSRGPLPWWYGQEAPLTGCIGL